MRYFVNPINTLEVEFDSKSEALEYAQQLFEKGVELSFGGRFHPKREGYKKPEELVEERWDSIEEMYSSL